MHTTAYHPRPETPDRAYVRHDDRRPWYLRLGEERVTVASGCPETACDPAPIKAHDLYCRTHDRLLPYATSTPTRARWFVVNLLRSLVCGVFALTAQIASPVPVMVLALLVGVAVLGLPLRHYPVGRAVAICLWLLICAVGTLAALTGTHGHRVIGTVSLALIALAWLGWVNAAVTDAARGARTRAGRIRRPDGGDRPGGRAAGVIASGLATVPLALAVNLLLAHGPSDWLLRLPEVRGWLLVAACGGLCGALLVALLVGALDGWGRVDLRVGQARLPARPAALRWTPVDRRWHGAPPRSFAGRLKVPALELRHQMATAALRCASFAVNVLRLTGHRAARAVVRMANFLFRQAVILVRRARMAVLRAGHALRVAAGVLAAAVPRSIRLVVLPVAVLVPAAVLVAPTAELTSGYLTSGGPGRLVLALLCALGSLALWTAAWAALTGEPFARTRDSALRTAELVLPQVVLLTTVGGWVLGLPGTLGHGRIHLGWLTLTLSALVVVFLVRAKPDRKPASSQ